MFVLYLPPPSKAQTSLQEERKSSEQHEEQAGCAAGHGGSCEVQTPETQGSCQAGWLGCIFKEGQLSLLSDRGHTAKGTGGLGWAQSSEKCLEDLQHILWHRKSHVSTAVM